MGKNRSYRATRVKQVDLADMHELGAEVIVGIDVAKHKLFACFAAGGSDAHLIVRWTHPTETREFFDLCLAMRARGQNLTMVLEPSGTYGDPILHWLWQQGFGVRRVLGKQVHDGAAALDGVASGHDPKAAALLVALHKLKGSQDWLRRTEDVRNLRALVSELRLYDGRIQRLAGMVEGMLARHWPELGAVIQPRVKIFWHLLAEYGGPRTVAAEPEAARGFMRLRGGYFFKDAKIAAVVEAARDTIGVPALPAEEQWMRVIAADYLHTLKLKRRILDEMKVAVRPHADPRLVALLGAGTVATLIGYNLDPLRFDSAAAFVKAMGLSLKERSSGEHKGRLRITKRGAPRVRWLMVMAAMRLIAHDPIVKAWHLKKRARDGVRRGTANGLISTVAIARKLARAAWHVARGADFDATKLYDVSRLSVPQTAAPAMEADIEAPLEELLLEGQLESDEGSDEAAEQAWFETEDCDEGQADARDAGVAFADRKVSDAPRRGVGEDHGEHTELPEHASTGARKGADCGAAVQIEARGEADDEERGAAAPDRLDAPDPEHPRQANLGAHHEEADTHAGDARDASQSGGRTPTPATGEPPASRRRAMPSATAFARAVVTRLLRA